MGPHVECGDWSTSIWVCNSSDYNVIEHCHLAALSKALCKELAHSQKIKVVLYLDHVLWRDNLDLRNTGIDERRATVVGAVWHFQLRVAGVDPDELQELVPTSCRS